MACTGITVDGTTRVRACAEPTIAIASASASAASIVLVAVVPGVTRSGTERGRA